MLMDMCSEFFSFIMTAGAYKLLDIHESCFQFSGTPGVGCRDGLFIHKALLNAQQKSQPHIICGFVGLVKAYDMANHALLLCILEQNGASLNFIAAIETICLHAQN